MGAGASSSLASIGELLRETQEFAKWSLEDVRQLHMRFKKQIFGFSLVETQFEAVMCDKLPNDVPISTLFRTLDNDHDGRIDGLEFIGGLAICCQGSFEEKARFAFELYDFNLNSSLSKPEMTMMLQSSLNGMLCLTGGTEENELPLEHFEQLTEAAFQEADRDNSGSISYEEFVVWARGNRPMMNCMERLRTVSQMVTNEAKSDDSASETDVSDSDIGCEGEHEPRAALFEAARNDVHVSLTQGLGGDQFMAVKPWQGAAIEPSFFQPKPPPTAPPASNLELEFVHGLRAQDCRNNVRYTAEGDLVYVAASLGVVYNRRTHTQRFYQGHTDDVIALALHPSGQVVATGQVGSNPTIHVWSTATMACLATLTGFHKRGISLLAFSDDGTQLASVGLDADHSVAIHDWQRQKLIASGKGSQSKLLDLAFSPEGRLVVVGVKTVLMYEIQGRALKMKKGILGKKGRLQPFLSVDFIESDPVVGTAAGELYVFRGRNLDRVVQAHGINDAVTCLSRCPGGLVSGGKDGLLCTWDRSLQIVGSTIDLSEDVDGDGSADVGSYNPRISSVHVHNNHVVIGTRGSEIFEARLGDVSPAGAGSAANAVSRSRRRRRASLARASTTAGVRKLLDGHCRGELWGLAMHPLRAEYATCGDDKTVRLWSVRRRQQIHMRALPHRARAVAYSPDGAHLAVALANGGVVVLDSSLDHIIVSFRHTSCWVQDIQYSPDGGTLAVASHDCNVYLYSVVDGQYTRKGVCYGHQAPVTHIDFSLDSRHIQSTCEGYELLFWDAAGNQIKSSAAARDFHWHTWTLPLGWPVQGIWPVANDGTLYNAVDRAHGQQVLAAADDFGRVQLFHYPAPETEGPRKTYRGHSAHVTALAFTRDDSYLVSVGGSDRCIFQWRHSLEDNESSDEEEAAMARAADQAEAAAGAGAAEDDSDDDGESALQPRVPTALQRDGPTVHPPVATAESLAAYKSVAPRAADSHDRASSRKEEKEGEAKKKDKPAPKARDGGAADPDIFETNDDDDFMAVRPWLGSIAEPSGFHMTPARMESTDVDLELDWVHGYRAQDCRNNLLYSSSGDVVWAAAAVGVVYSKATGQQRFQQGAHKSDIISLAMHPSGTIAATGDLGKRPRIIVWDLQTMEILSVLKGFHRRGIALLNFCDKGDYLVSVGLDDDHSVAVYDWRQKRKLCSATNDKNKVLAAGFLGMVADDGDAAGALESKSDGEDEQPTTGVRRAGSSRHSRSVRGGGGQGGGGAAAVGGTLGSGPVGQESAQTQARVRFLTAGKNHVKFWTSSGSNLSSQRGIFGKKGTVQTAISYAWFNSWAVTGMADGSIYSWTGHTVSGVGRAHEAAVNALYASGDQFLVSGGKDGRIVKWSSSLDVLMWLDVATSTPTPPLKSAVRSVCYKDGLILCGTQSSDIIEFSGVGVEGGAAAAAAATAGGGANNMGLLKASATPHHLLQGHCVGELWGLATHPSQALYATAADDSTVRLWNATEHRCVARTTVPAKGRALAFSPGDGAHLAVGLNSGTVLVLRAAALEEAPLATLTEPSQWVSDLKYAPSGELLAVASHDHLVHLYSVSMADGAYAALRTLQGHPTALKSLDFSDDSRYLQTNCYAYELRFWDVETGEEARSASQMRDVKWETWTCTMGWPVQGIWPARHTRNVGDINAVDRSHTYNVVPVIATGDEHGHVKLFNYPSVSSGAAEKTFLAHAGNVTNLRFTHDDAYLVTTGGDDRVVFQWRTDCIEEARALEAAGGADVDDAMGNGGAPAAAGATLTASALEAHGAAEEAKRSGESKDDGLDDEAVEFDFDTGGGLTSGDQFMAVKPYLGAIREPSNWREPANAGAAPAEQLELEFVHGYSAQACRNNVRYGDDTWEVVYHTAGVGVVYDMRSHTQRCHVDHTDDILSLAVANDGSMVATGESGRTPKILLWDPNSGSTLRTIQGFHKRGVILLAFTNDGSMLASIGLDNDHSLALYTLEGNLIASSKVGQNKVLGLAFGPSNELVTVGVKHVKMWNLNQRTLQSKKGLFGNRKGGPPTVVAVAFLGADAVTGQTDGSIFLWKGRNKASDRQEHQGAVNALYTLPDNGGIASGSKDGKVILWDGVLAPVHVIDLNSVVPAPLNAAVRSVCVRGGRVLVGTQGSEIYEIDQATAEAAKLVEGHFRGELWGLATHPTQQQFITAGDDCTVRAWDCPTRRLMAVATLDDKVRAADYSPDGTHVAFGLNNGNIAVYSADLGTVIANKKCAREWIQVLRYSPDGTTLAIGSHDNSVYLWQTSSYGQRAVCRGHSSYITHIDFSHDSKVLQTNCGAYELLFWNCETGDQITSASSLRDTNWASFTCTLGFPVQGIWPAEADGTDVNSVSRSRSGSLLATGDDFGAVKLFKYPCVKPKAQFKTYAGHSSHVTSVSFTAEDRFLLSTGGNDRTVMQFKVTSA